MKPVSESAALSRLAEIKQTFKQAVEPFESNAESCAQCETPGACCLDAHFVNVRISRLEAVAISRYLETLTPEMRDRVRVRRIKASGQIALSQDRGVEPSYACPLFEPGVGCLVHDAAKPLPCIHHACYEKAEDLPPEDLLANAETEVDALNRRTYLSSRPILALPLAIGGGR